MALKLTFKPGLNFELKNVKIGIHSEETLDYIADLYCNNVLIGRVENDGRGGCTFFYYSQKSVLDRDTIRGIEKNVEQYPMIVCDNGHIIHWSLGDIADEIVYNDKKIMAKVGW